MADLPPLAVALKAYRKQHGLTQEQFAAARGISVDTIRHMEGKLSPTGSSAMLAAWAIGELSGPIAA